MKLDEWATRDELWDAIVRGINGDRDGQTMHALIVAYLDRCQVVGIEQAKAELESLIVEERQ